MARPPLIPGIDYYVEDGKFVFTPEYHLKRGHCCNSKCRHCPYGLASSPTPAPQVTRIEISGPAPVTDVKGDVRQSLPCDVLRSLPRDVRQSLPSIEVPALPGPPKPKGSP